MGERKLSLFAYKAVARAKIIPLENHLLGLKAAIYDKPYLNDVSDSEIGKFTCVKTSQIKMNLILDSNEAIQSLFRMTPYYYKTSPKDKSKLDLVDSLEITAEFISKGIQRAVAKQAAKILTIAPVAREVFACFILKKLVVFHRRSLFSFAIIL